MSGDWSSFVCCSDLCEIRFSLLCETFESVWAFRLFANCIELILFEDRPRFEDLPSCGQFSMEPGGESPHAFFWIFWQDIQLAHRFILGGKLIGVSLAIAAASCHASARVGWAWIVSITESNVSSFCIARAISAIKFEAS